MSHMRTWSEIHQDKSKGVELSPLEQFIYDNEPALDKEAKKFRLSLQKIFEKLESQNLSLQIWFDKTDFVQTLMDEGKLPTKYLGWHRADILKDLIYRYIDLETARSK